MDVLYAAARAGSERVFLLESALPDPDLGRWSFVGARPAAIVEGRVDRGPDGLLLLEAALEAARAGAAPDALREARERLPASGIPFAGGAVGFISYDYGRRLERLPSRAADDQRFPALSFGIYPHVLAHDGEQWWVAGARAGFEAAWKAAIATLADAERSALDPPQLAPLAPRAARRTFTPETYRAAVARAIEYIRAGDIFEVNLSQRFEVELDHDEPAVATYRRLRGRAAAPLCAFIDAGGGRAVLSLSPERFLSLRGRAVETWPIKGTRPRGRTPEEDRALAAELRASAKDRAELAMIVDLARNDLGRVAEAGSVRVRADAELRTLPAVHHLVGRVEARLARGRGPLDLVRATFPGGSITGAPKVRAMEIIDEIEPVRRSVYCGAIGYVGLDGDLELSIAIRTALRDGRRVTFQAGGAVTAASDPAAEHEETIAKARAIAEALGAEIDADARGRACAVAGAGKGRAPGA
jgi:para-aminobenzoate synthetase component 1